MTNFLDMLKISKREEKEVKIGVVEMLGTRFWFRGNDTAVGAVLEMYNNKRGNGMRHC